jgi:hypothetical protein
VLAAAQVAGAAQRIDRPKAEPRQSLMRQMRIAGGVQAQEVLAQAVA